MVVTHIVVIAIKLTGLLSNIDYIIIFTNIVVTAIRLSKNELELLHFW